MEEYIKLGWPEISLPPLFEYLKKQAARQAISKNMVCRSQSFARAPRKLTFWFFFDEKREEDRSLQFRSDPGLFSLAVTLQMRQANRKPLMASLKYQRFGCITNSNGVNRFSDFSNDNTVVFHIWTVTWLDFYSGATLIVRTFDL